MRNARSDGHAAFYDGIAPLRAVKMAPFSGPVERIAHCRLFSVETKPTLLWPANRRSMVSVAAVRMKLSWTCFG